MGNFITKTDYYFAELFHNLCVWGGKFTNVLMKLISYIGEYGALFLLIGLGLALFKRTRKIGGTIILSIAIGFVISNLILKNAIQRIRPFEASSQFKQWWECSNGKFESGYSFPSGHVTASMAFAVAVMLTTNKKRSWPVLFLPVIMASSRMYLMVHYFTDCLGGMAVGLVGGLIAYFILNWIYKSEIKLFVWIRQLNLFTSKSSESKSSKNKRKVETKQSTQVDNYNQQGSDNEGSALVNQKTQEIEQQENINTK